MDTLIRKMTRSAYDIQALRIATGLRVVMQFKERFNESFSENEDSEELEKKKEKILKGILTSYERVTDGVVFHARKKQFTFDNILKNENELWFVENYLSVLDSEKESFKRLSKALLHESFYVSYLQKVKGIGPAMAGVILSEFDPYKAKYPSSFHKYAGLDVVAIYDSESNELLRTEGRSRKENHLVDVEYVSKSGEVKIRKGITYNPWLKSKLLAVLATSFLRSKNEKYVKVYQDYKFRQLNRPDMQNNPAIKIIAHKRALRYMIKIFLIDLHIAWRSHEGLPVSVSYAEAKLGLKHGQDIH